MAAFHQLRKKAQQAYRVKLKSIAYDDWHPTQVWRRLRWQNRLATAGFIGVITCLGVVYWAGSSNIITIWVIRIIWWISLSLLLAWLGTFFVQWRRLTRPRRLLITCGIIAIADLVLATIIRDHTQIFVGIFIIILLSAVIVWLGTIFVHRELLWIRLLVVGGIFAIVCLILNEIAVMAGIRLNADNVAGWTLYVLLIVSFLAFLGHELMQWTEAPPASRALILLGILFLYLFPSALVFLATNGQADFLAAVLSVFRSGNGLGWLTFPEFVLLVSVPSLLILLPEALRRIIRKSVVSDLTKSVLPGWLAAVSSLATGVYIFALHFDKGPLSRTSLNQVTFAAIAVALLLAPIYKSIVEACWERGIADVFNPGSWIARPRTVIKEFQTVYHSPADNSKIEPSASHAEAAAQAQPDGLM